MFLGLGRFSRLVLWFAAFRKLLGHHGLASAKFLWCLCLLSVMSLPQQVWTLPYKIGVVGPWACDSLFSKALPEVAARLAIERINRDPSFDLSYSFEYVILNEDCQTSRALSSFISHHQMASGFIGPTNPGYCEAASLLGNSWDKGIFSWACVNYELDNKISYPTFSRTLPSPIRVLVTVMKYFQWAHAGVISSDEDIWVHTANRVASALRSHGLPVGVVLTTGQDSQSMRKALQRIHQADRIRIIIMCMHSALIGGETQMHLLECAHDLKMTDGTYVFVPYDALLYSLPYKHTPYRVLRNNPKLREAYDAVLTITVESQEKTFYQAFTEAAARGEIPEKLEFDQVSPLFGTIYNSIYFIAQAMNNAMKENGQAGAASLVQHSRNMQFHGFNQLMRTDSNGNGISEYVILDTNLKEWELHSTYTVDMEMELLRFGGTPIHFPGGRPPRADAKCWFAEGKICHGGIDPAFAMMVCLTLLIALLSINGFAYFIRRRINKIQLIKGPNRILLTLEDVTFINPHFGSKRGSRASVSFQITSEVQSGRSPRLSFSSGSLTPATYENSNIAIYEGDWVWLKKFSLGDFGDLKSIKSRASDVFEMMKDLRHENINPLLGFFYDSGMFAIVTEFCSRGSLEDILTNQDVKLDWMFKSSLLLDLIKGMKYLHHREFVHGRLKSRNCVVDGRFVLKVTDYGFNDILEMLRLSEEESSMEELLWTAPELLRAPRGSRLGSFAGDVYSFAIIMQEVMVRGTPFCMMDLPAQEIINRLKKPPPVYRPVVPPEHAPPECLQLMKQCWAEAAEQRPTFDEIFNQFKTFNKGKKTNIIDSMLRMLEQYSSNLEDLIRERTEELEIEKQKTEKLLTQMLPPSVAESLKKGCTVEPEGFDLVTLYFSDIVGFTTISAMSEPIEVVDLLNDLYTLFDAIIGSHDVYKVETIGDAYMVASGLPKRNGSRHAAEIANMSLDILSSVGTFKMRHMPEVPVRIRIGLHSGPVVAGVVGLTMPRYCLFGDTVNTASRMESTGLPYRIHVSLSTVTILQNLSEGYEVELRGRTELKGKGTEETFWLIGKKGFMKPLPVPPPVDKDGQVGHGLQPVEIAAFQRRKAERQLVRNKP
ncbi:retinal guanylyl cyclase 2 [Homo sapiens]|uniref:Retinal guanylyl cyclase 2 n=1 Tax=Homo sapiens TaxID=9606 RepID=GUC2F_HUMAN|nr:retinal guanylyl cyclase 2 [Homo sapiens]P51841.2 RecName: Full=Retinal guanylyl cyclase 2; Short=RETGC-2; AltName: Full=Guanylate cyclase 2F, retinal; AltName: Full=Guanylate cyclase F; Short=GC-F; AltName: Full=Rod outer segment membrane guanylate cyclase 2; Short=ROS-GC2; Flags: Precursor [Homo sapiens]AAI56675.1 Guanylate cyclase 2F, retinal [synthetic construct]|eukprot:NP_001513.2 retinal guanylyl cyclase 2 [Homo sapiens]